MTSIFLKYDTLIKHVQENGIDDYKNWLNESIFRLHKQINYRYVNISPISFAIHCFKPDLIMWMINKNININGILEDGYGYYSSISSIILIDVYFLNFVRKTKYLTPLTKQEKKKIFCMKQVIFDLLILQGADINMTGVNGKNLLALECSKPVPLIDIKWIKYILSKGINPNFFNFIPKTETILIHDSNSWLSYKKDNHQINSNLCVIWFFQPIVITYWSMVLSILYIYNTHEKLNSFLKLLQFTVIKDWNIEQIKKNVYNILSLLVFNGANLDQCQSDNRTLYQIIHWVQNDKKKNTSWYLWIKHYNKELNFDYYWKKLNRTSSNIIKRHAKHDIPRIRHLQVLLKLEYCNLKNIANRKYICNKILRNHKKKLNKKKYTNININSSCESINDYSPLEIVEYKNFSPTTNKYDIWAFHISEIPNLIQTQINPFTRKKIKIDIIKEWYNLLDNNLLPLCYPPLTMKDISNIKFTKPILSRPDSYIYKDTTVLDFDFSHIDNKQIKNIFELYSDVADMNTFIQKTIRKIRKKKISISTYLEQRNKIKTKTKIISKEYKQSGFGIFFKKFSNKIILDNIQRIINCTSIGKYINLILWLDSWPYVLIFKLLFDLYIHNEIILDQNWVSILDIWKHRKSYTRYKMKKFFIDIFIFIVCNGLNNNTLQIDILSSIILQLHKDFLYIKKLQKIIWKLYENNILTTFDIIENTNNLLFDNIKNELPNFYQKIIDTIKFDSDDIFHISVNNLQITLHDSPSFQYFETTLAPDMKHLAYFQWNLMTDIDKEPFMLQGMQIKENTEFQINKTWRQIQELLFLINNEKFYHDL